jgi:ABC-type nitrate/sulfonate/bicarbonate transport system ATPase subunit
MLLNLYQENLLAEENGNRPPHTILLVTHELNEALYVADRVIGLSQYHENGSRGATIVYDKAAPIFHPKEPKDVAGFLQQKDELRKAVFDPKHLQHHQEYVSFWTDLQQRQRTADKG